MTRAASRRGVHGRREPIAARVPGRAPLRGLPGPAWIAPVAIVVVALVVRLWEYRYQAWVTVDGSEYIRFAEALLRGEAFRSIFPPGYPLLIAAVRLVVSDRVAAAAAVSIVCGALLPWPVWVLARRVVGTWAWLPALAVALHPGLVRISAVTMSDSAYLLALYGALALAAARPWGAGLLLGAGFALRPEALLPAVVLGLGGAIAVRRGALRARALAAAAGGFLVLAVPCWLYFHATLGAWTLTPKTVVAVAANEDWRQMESRIGAPAVPEPGGLSGRVLRHGPGALRESPARALRYGRLLLDQWPVSLLFLSLLGLWRRRGLEAIPLLHVIVLPFLAVSAQPRFLLGAVPALAVAAIVPFAHTRRWVWVATLAVLGVSGVAWRAATGARELTSAFEAYMGAEKDAGEWLAGVSAPGEAVMDRKPPVAFYANRPYRVIPDRPYEEILRFARREHVRYLVLEEGVVRVFRPQLAPLLYDAGFRARQGGLEMVYFGGHHKGYGVVIFRVLRPGELPSGRPPVARLRWRESGRPAGNATPRALP